MNEGEAPLRTSKQAAGTDSPRGTATPSVPLPAGPQRPPSPPGPAPQDADLTLSGLWTFPGPAVHPAGGKTGGAAPAEAPPERAGTRAGGEPGRGPRARGDGGRRPGLGLAAAAGAARGHQVPGRLGPAAARLPRHAAAQGRQQEGPVQGLLRPETGPDRLHERPGLLERRHLAAGFEYIFPPMAMSGHSPTDT